MYSSRVPPNGPGVKFVMIFINSYYCGLLLSPAILISRFLLRMLGTFVASGLLDFH